jgi:uncharacterized protein
LLFDIHTYMGKNPGWGVQGLPVPFTGKDMIQYMDDAGFDAVLSAPPGSGNSDHFAGDHETIAKAVEKYPGRIYGYYRAKPRRGKEGVADLLYWIKKRGLHAIKFNSSDTPGYSIGDHDLMGPVLEAVEECGVPVLIHTGEVYSTGATPALVCDLARAFPRVQFIVGHMGIPGYFEELIPFMKNTKNTVTETAGVYRPLQITNTVKALGAERVLLGSNGPYIPLQLGSIAIGQYCGNLTQREKDLILGGNAVRILKLKATAKKTAAASKSK